MKKRFFCMSLILVMLLSVSAHAIQIRSITSVPHLSFDGNTPGYRYFVDAFCYAGDKTGYDEKAYSSVVKTAVR